MQKPPLMRAHDGQPIAELLADLAAIDAVASAIQHWYRRHSIRRYLARQTRRRLAATTIQRWMRYIWLARQQQKRLRLRLLCRGASAHASLVRGNRRPPPTPTNTSSDPKISRHPFRARGQPLPRRKRTRRSTRRRIHSARKTQPPHPPNQGGSQVRGTIIPSDVNATTDEPSRLDTMVTLFWRQEFLCYIYKRNSIVGARISFPGRIF
jgi:hypothetical protein